MKLVVIGGSGLIGTGLVQHLRQQGQEVVAASRSSGVNALTGEGLAEALVGAQVVVDVANSPSFEDAAVLKFFETSGRNLLPAEVAAGVRHHVGCLVVGAERLPDSGYMRAKVAQERLIRSAGIPYTIVPRHTVLRVRRRDRRVGCRRGYHSPSVRPDATGRGRGCLRRTCRHRGEPAGERGG